MQPSGNLHIGNYLGAIKPWVALQHQYRSAFCIVDLHAITTLQASETLSARTLELAAILLASGIEPNISSLYVQSRIPAHAEMAWIVECLTPFGWLRRMTQFKDKSAKEETVSAGLFAYPALMAADILLYQADVVPVGEDQLQHIELTRDVAQRFNSMYGHTFALPEPIVTKNGSRIMALGDPANKMSKSDANPANAIYLLDSPDVVRAKISRATTDSLREIRFDAERPGLYNLLSIYQSFTGDSNQAVEARFNGKGYADLKRELADVVTATLTPLQQRYSTISQDAEHLRAILDAGEEQVRPDIQSTLSSVKEKMGFWH